MVPTFAVSIYSEYSHARSGNPNTYAEVLDIAPAIEWLQPDTSGDALTWVLDAGDIGFKIVSDPETREMVCRFWREGAAAMTDLRGRHHRKAWLGRHCSASVRIQVGFFYLSWWLRSVLGC